MTFLRHLLKRYHLGLLVLPLILGSIGVLSLYSVANGSWYPWSVPHVLRLGLGFVVMLAIGLIPLNRLLVLAYPFYFSVLLLLVLTPFFGTVGLGAKRWIGLYGLQIQPAELMRITIIMVIARFFHHASGQGGVSLYKMLPILAAVIVPTALIFLQPDLGTAMVLACTSLIVIFIAGLNVRVFVIGGSLLLIAFPFAWNFLRPYQKQRILSFLSPESDPLGSGYHIIQSKIAFGSGGITGRGFLEGPQNQLAFLPEAHTDFIFTVIGEEFGLIGSTVTIILWVLLVWMAYRIGLSCRYRFGRLLACGIAVLLFFYFFINNAMVVGLLPVVGVPMPLVSYGGSAILSTYLAIGLLQSIHAWRDDEFQFNR